LRCDNSEKVKTIQEVCGISRDGSKKWWWWNGYVNKVLREKKEKYKIWRKKREAESRAEYVQSRRSNANRIFAKAMNDKVTKEALKIEEVSAHRK